MIVFHLFDECNDNQITLFEMCGNEPQTEKSEYLKTQMVVFKPQLIRVESVLFKTIKRFPKEIENSKN